MERIAVEIVPVDLEQARAAREAFRRFGKGRHPAGLNFGDCFSYALARMFGEPLLFKGTDFGQTDLLASPPPANALPRRFGGPFPHQSACDTTSRRGQEAQSPTAGPETSGDPPYEALVQFGQLLRMVFLADYFINDAFRR